MMTSRLWPLRISRAFPWLVIGPPVLLPLLSHVLGHPFGGQRANGTHSGPSVSCYYSTPLGYYENSGTMRLASCRPSHVPHQRNVLARRRCPIHALACVRYASSIGQGVAWKKADSIPTDGVGDTDVLPTSVRFHHWTLGFGQCRSHRIAQALQDHAIHVF